MKEIYLAGGCFWGVDEYMSRIDGVVDTKSGYANGSTENPSYEQVCTGTTGHTEAVKVIYDENIISLKDLLNRFWRIIDPTLLNRQGPDIGSQYRTGIYYIDDADLTVINETLNEVKGKYDKPIVTEIGSLENFYLAEEYHQDYLKKNPAGYCHINMNI